jgi:hypothetical protein
MRRAIALLLLILPSVAPPGAAESVRVEQLSEHRLRLTLPAELGSAWSEVNIGRLRVRTANRQSALDRRRLSSSAALDVSVDARGCSLLQIDVGPPASRGYSDSWQRVTRCSKIATCGSSADRADRRRAGALLTAKTGSRIEIRPLFNPLELVPGSDLPVRLYFGGESVQTVVTGVGPDGAHVQADSDRVGIAFLRIPRSGRWTLRFAHQGAVAELIFDVQGDVPGS